MASTPAYVTPNVLRWARESVGYDVETAASKINVKPEKLAGAEQGDLLLTLRQAEEAARVYNRPLATLFLPEPPVEAPQDAQFRRLPGAPTPPWPPEMVLLSRAVAERQEAALELYEALGETPPWRETRLTLAEPGAPGAEFARELLGVTRAEQESWRDYQGYAPLRAWVDAVESLGIVVMQDGTLPVEMMRGFAAPHNDVPVIVVNTQDDPRARAFTIVHELGHLYLWLLGRPVGPETEPWCDEFAADVLMPRDWLQSLLTSVRGASHLDTVDALALRLGVTPLALAVRLAKMELWPQARVDRVIHEIRQRGPRGGGSGGNYYLTQIARNGPAFISLVFTALDNQAVTYPVASTMLGGVKVSNFARLRDEVAHRAEPS